MNLYAVYDKAAELYTGLIEDQNDATAIRSFLHACQDPQTSLAIKPSDYALYCLGTYDRSTGIVSSCEPRKVQDGRRMDDA